MSKRKKSCWKQLDTQQIAWNDPNELKKRRALRPEKKQDKVSQLAPPIAKSEAGNVAVPSFLGLTMDQVRKLARTTGITVRYRGTGLAHSQDVQTHERVPAWTPVTVFFQPRGRSLPVKGLGTDDWTGEDVAEGSE